MKNYLEAAIRKAKARSTTRALAGFDDHLLRDIGITRADISLMMAGNRTAHGKVRADHE